MKQRQVGQIIGPIQIVMVFFFMILIPVILGIPFLTEEKMEEERGCLFLAAIYGMLVMMASFWLLALPMILLKLNFLVLTYVWMALLIAGAIASLIRMLLKKQFDTIKEHVLQMWKNKSVLLFLVILAVAFQTWMLAFFCHVDDDDSFYVATAVTTWTENSMYRINPYTGNEYLLFPWRYFTSPFPVFVAAVSRLCGIHPAIMAHTFLPVIFIPAAYIVYWLFSRRLFQGNTEKQGYFMLFLCLMTSFGLGSIYSLSAFLLTRIWQGKAILVAVFLPLVYFLMDSVIKNSFQKKEMVLLLLLSMSSVLVSSMAVVLLPLACGVVALLESIRQKKFSILVKTGICCLPCILNGMVVLIYQLVK